MGTPGRAVIIENHEVKGVAVARQPRILPNEVFEERGRRGRRRRLDAAGLGRAARRARVGAAGLVRGPDQFLAQPHFKVTWLGLYLASNEPAAILDRKELSTWLHAPLTRDSRLLLRADRL